MAYATPADWATRTGTPVPSGPALAQLQTGLDSASRKVGRLLKGARYSVDSLGNATDAGVVDVLRQMTLDQYAYTASVDSTGFGLGLEPVTVGPVVLAGTGGVSSGAVSPYAPAAIERALDAGLLTAAVGSF